MKAGESAPHGIARVIIDSPLPQLDHLFDYRIPAELAGQIVQGVRVRVPLRTAGRIADAFVVEVADTTEIAGALSDVEALISAVPVLAADVWRLARAAADRAAGGASDILRLAVPKRQARVEKAWLAARNASDAPAVPTPEVTVGPTELEGYGPELLQGALSGAKLAVSALPHLSEVDGQWVGAWSVTAAELAAASLAAGRSTIIVVPDYRDQDQLEVALAALLPSRSVLRFDARQSNPDRYRALLRAKFDGPSVVVGNRSAVYAPVSDLGLIIIWDEGDSLHAEPLAPYVHSRDAALLRQEQSGCSLVFLSHSPSTAVQRLVGVGWLAQIAPPRARHPRIVLTGERDETELLANRARIPSGTWRAASDALAHGPVLVQVARPGDAALRAMRVPRDQQEVPVAIDAGRTAHELGRAFPGIRVIVADGDHPLQVIDAKPALIVATRGAEPRAAGGYRAILLLDGERMLMREQAKVAEDCLRWWSNAASLAAPGASVHLVGVTGDIATAFATWRQPLFAEKELSERRQLRFPPAVRVASVTGAAKPVQEILDQAAELGAQTMMTEPAERGVHAVVRFEYSAGTAIAQFFKAEIVRAAAGRRRPPGRESQYPPPPTLRVRMDDVDVL